MKLRKSQPFQQEFQNSTCNASIEGNPPLTFSQKQEEGHIVKAPSFISNRENIRLCWTDSLPRPHPHPFSPTNWQRYGAHKSPRCP